MTKLAFPRERFRDLPAHEEIGSAAARLLAADPRVVGLYLLGSFADGTPDRFSDIDIYIVLEAGTREEVIAEHLQSVITKAGEVGTIFPATHLGDPFQIIAFYKSELPVHVDYQYQESADLAPNAKGKNALILLDRTGDVGRWRQACQEAEGDDEERASERLQYIEDCFWAWCWYTQAKIERGELWEARDAIEYVRTEVLVSLADMVLGLPHEGNRRLEGKYPAEILKHLERTAPSGHSKVPYQKAMSASVTLYLYLFELLPGNLEERVRMVDRDYFVRFLPGPESWK
jgi:predicted nucleotidyltransferase